MADVSSPALGPHALEHDEHLGLISRIKDSADRVDHDSGDGQKIQTAATPDSQDVENSTVESTVLPLNTCRFRQ
jgi:hypothetical protein